MGDVVDISRYANARDRKLLGEIVQSAQLAQAFASYERSFFLASPEDQRKIADRFIEMSVPAAIARPGVMMRFWSPVAAPAGLMPGVTRCI